MYGNGLSFDQNELRSDLEMSVEKKKRPGAGTPAGASKITYVEIITELKGDFKYGI